MQVEKKKIYRVLDANFNRAKEGLRVCEDICRFFLDDAKTTKEYKTIRHRLTKFLEALDQKKIELIKERQIDSDVGKRSLSAEFKREGVKDIFYANSQRAKESIRVLEEFAKLIDKRIAGDLKRMRYKIYALEKTIVGRP